MSKFNGKSKFKMPKLMLLQTTTTQKNAEELVEIVLESRLSPCIQQSRIKSSYFWSDTQENLKAVSEEEILLCFKVFKKDFKALKQIILSHHSYTLPEIIGISLCKVSKEYKHWCRESLFAQRINIME